MDTSPYEVVRLSDDDQDEWDRLVRESSQGTPFHYYESLETFSSSSNTRLHPLVSYNGQEIVGLFPVFERSHSVVSMTFSPPPNLKVPYLGPILIDYGHLSRRNLERRQLRFVRSCLEHLRSTVGPQYVYLRTTFGYPDPRPFDWEGFEFSPRFTYVVDLTPGREQLFDQFSRDARSNVRDCEDAGCVIELGGIEEIRWTIEQVRERHEEQGESYPIDSSFLEALYERLPSGAVRPYVCRLDGEFVGGNIILTAGDTACAWVGSATPDVGLGVNDALHWRAMRDAIDRGELRYDLAGANKERLSSYKSKFAPDLEPYYVIRKRTQYMRVVEGVYNYVT